MGYSIQYACVSHIGNVRLTNQDNFLCDGQHMDLGGSEMEWPLRGMKRPGDRAVFGVFDGLGGEECGEVASYIAAKTAGEVRIGADPVEDLRAFCFRANEEICRRAASGGISSMGTTAAMLVFGTQQIALCNIGDSKIFRFCGGALEQISVDHVEVCAHGVKPPLSQSLGIPPEELVIAPYLARGKYHDGDSYLICSDGLTDMVGTEEISRILASASVEEAARLLLEQALGNGGKDNTTVILCKVRRMPPWPFGRIKDRKEVR